MENYFSVVLPVYQGGRTIARAISSLINQSYPNWELVIINDGSTDNTQEVVSQAMRHDRRIRMFIMPENAGRLVARNMGNRLARNEWICMLDADDEYMTNYLEVLNDEINRNPNYKIFNFGTLMKQREMVNGFRYEKGWNILEPFNLKEIGLGMETFTSGKITTGGFIFKKELLGGVSFYPETKIPYGGEDSFPSMLVKKDPIFKEFCKQDKDGNWLPLGNPWGDEPSLFWWLTRNYKSKCLDVILNIHHIRP